MFAVFVLLALSQLVTPLVTYDTCGTLLGDGRYCRNYTSKDLSDLPNEGWNVTTILILSDNHISALHKEPFKHDSLLVEVDLRDNHIQYIDKHAFSGLPNLARVYLGNNRLHCDVSICGFRDWLLINNNKNKVVDINNVKCLTPDRYKGSPILNLPNAACKNTSYDNAFEINTDTVIGIVALVGVIFVLLILACLRDRWSGNRRTARTLLLMHHLHGLPVDYLERGREEPQVQRYWPDPQNDPGTSGRMVHVPIERIDLGLDELGYDESERGRSVEGDPFVGNDPFLYQDRGINQSIQSLNMGVNVEDF